ncbi:MAG TPA: polymorphic toxin type 15 domain-containing protein [Kofleriaceae bacterium]|nr:polymorphic toxin type 15 domain-containing protein [Kofleriaceae bacterium]
MKAAAQRAISAIPTSSPAVKTDPGPAPVTELAGQADPVRSLADHQHAVGDGARALDAEKQKVVAGPGAAQVQPAKLDEKLKVPKEQAIGPMPALPAVEGMAKFKAWKLPAEAQTAFDDVAKPKMDASLAEARAKMAQAETKRDADRTKAVADAHEKVKQSHADADKQQQAQVAQSRTQIANRQAETLVKQENEVKKLDQQATQKKQGTIGTINTRIRTDQAKVAGDYQGAQKRAEDEKRKGEAEAERKKQKAQDKDKSWWEQATDVISDGIQALADEVTKVLEDVGKAIGHILDEVKDAACRVIDAARDFVCEALTELGDWLKSAVTSLLGSVFPELAAELNRLIDTAVNAAKTAVTAIADGLKKSVTALCDGLKGAIAGVLAAFKAAVQAAATFAKAAVTGDWALVAKMVLEGILKVLGIDPAAFYALLGKAADSIDKIIENPGAFVGHLVDAVKLGFKQFGANFWTHLKDGVVQWLFGTFAEAGIRMPASFDIAGIFDLVAQVLGLTWTRMRGKVVKVIGEKNTERLEFVSKYIEALITGGFAGLWEKIQQDMSGLWDIVVGGIKSWLIEKVVQQAIIKIATMWNPVGAIIQLIQTAWNVYQWVKENAQRIFGLVQAVVNSVADIVAGNIAGAANYIESSLAKLVPMAISLFADLLGLGGIADKIRGIIEKVQTMVDNAIDKLINRVMGMFKGGTDDKDDDKDKKDQKEEGKSDLKEFDKELKMDGEDHTLFAIPQSDGSVEVQMASANREPIKNKIAQAKKLATELAGSSNPAGKKKGEDMLVDLQPIEAEVAKLRRAEKKNTQKDIDSSVEVLASLLVAFGRKYDRKSLEDAGATLADAEGVFADPPIAVPAFECRAKYDFAEYVRQVKLQEDGINSQTIPTWETYGQQYEQFGRSEEGAQQQKQLQEDMGSPNAGKAEVDKVAALHSADQVAHGAPDPDSLGSKAINSSIGSQWIKNNRIQTIRDAVHAFKANRASQGKQNTKEELRKFQMNVRLSVVKA